MGASELQNEFQEAAAEVESIAGETFVFRGTTYRGVLNQQPILLALTVPGMSESAEAMLAATVAQFGDSPPTELSASTREIITIREREWKIVSYESDTLHIRLGLRLSV